MSKLPTELVECYQEWLEITRFEHRMINERNWAKLNSLDSKKEAIVKHIQTLEIPGSKHSEALRSLIHQIADLEQLNQSLIKERSKEIQIQINDIGRRTRLLNKFQKKYMGSSETPKNRPSQKA